MAVSCKLWLLAAVILIAIMNQDGVLCGKNRRLVETDEDDESSVDESGDKGSGGASDFGRSVEVSGGFDRKRVEKSEKKMADSDERAVDVSRDDDGVESDEEENYVDSKIKRGAQGKSQKNMRIRDDDSGDVNDDVDEENEDSDEKNNSKLKKVVRYKKDRKDVDKEYDEKGGNKQYRKKGAARDENHEYNDEDKLESSTTIISGDAKQVLKYINGEIISFQPKALDFTKKPNQKLKEKVEKIMNKSKSDSDADGPESNITIYIHNVRKRSPSKKVSKDVSEEKFLMDAMKKFVRKYIKQRNMRYY